MPVMLRVGGYAFKIYPDDHAPPHVHVWHAGGEAIILIESAAVRSAWKMKAPAIARARSLVEAHRDELLSAWIGYASKEGGVTWIS